MDTSLLVLCVFSCICFVLQLLPILSVPVTGKAVGYTLFLSEFNDLKFGVFGVCNITNNVCSKPRIGYPARFNDLEESASVAVDTGFIQLPSRTRYTVSKLLIVHVVGFCFSAILFMLLSGLLLHSFSKDRQIFKMLRAKKTREHSSTDLMASKNLISRARPPKKYNGDISPYLTLSLLLSLLSFLLTLLAFLVDILLFVPHLGYVGWVQMCPVVITMLIACMVCFKKRSIETRRYYNSTHSIEFNDMRTRQGSHDFSRDSSVSDDGFFVYTNGFYSSQKPEEDVQDSALLEPRWEWRNRNGSSQVSGGGYRTAENAEPPSSTSEPRISTQAAP